MISADIFQLIPTFLDYFWKSVVILIFIRSLIGIKLKVDRGNPIFLVNIDRVLKDKVANASGITKCKELAKHFDRLYGEEANDVQERIYVCHKDIAGLCEVNKSFCRGRIGRETPVIQAGDTRWITEMQLYRWRLGYQPLENTHRVVFDTGVVSEVMQTLGEFYNYQPIYPWEKKSEILTQAIYKDDVDPFDSIITLACKEPYEKQAAYRSVLENSKLINVFRITNNENQSLHDLHFFIEVKDRQWINVVGDIAKINGFDLMESNNKLAHLKLANLPGGSERHLVIETNGKPLDTSDLLYEVPLLAKYGKKTLRHIAIAAIVIAFALAMTTHKYDTTKIADDMPKEERSSKMSDLSVKESDNSSPGKNKK